ncbi:MAG: Uma2 family endonuclease [Bacteroidia bacterium]
MLIIEGLEIRNYSEHMSDGELFEFCADNPQLRIERDSRKNIIIMSPADGESGYFEKEFIVDIGIWTRSHSGVSCSSNTGFLLPNGAMRAPDASWISPERWNTLSSAEKSKFLAVVPDFVVEVRSPSDNIHTLGEKMLEWIENGVRLAWLIDPQAKRAFIYREDGSVDTVEGFDQKLSGENVLEEFVFDLSQLQIP